MSIDFVKQKIMTKLTMDIAVRALRRKKIAMNEDALDAMIYAWYTLEEKRRRKMIDYTDFGRIIDIKTFTEEFGEDHKIVITFSLSGQVYPEKLANASYSLNRIRSYPDNYVICDIDEIIRAKQMETADREEIIKLKRENEKLKELNKSIVDRNNRLAAECTDYEERLDAAKDREDYWKDRHYKLDKEFNLLKQGHDRLQSVRQKLEEGLAKKTEEFDLLKQKYDVIFDAGNIHRDENIKLREKVEKLKDKWDAMYTSLKEKGVEVLYLGDVDGHPFIDVKFADEWLLNKNIMKLIGERNSYSTQNKKDKEEIEKLNEALKDSDHLCRVRSDIINDKNQRIKELEERIKELESDKTARVTINPNGSLTFSRDGKSETVLMPVEEEDPTKCVHYSGSGICYARSMETPSLKCTGNPHPCKLYRTKKE